MCRLRVLCRRWETRLLLLNSRPCPRLHSQQHRWRIRRLSFYRRQMFRGPRSARRLPPPSLCNKHRRMLEFVALYYCISPNFASVSVGIGNFFVFPRVFLQVSAEFRGKPRNYCDHSFGTFLKLRLTERGLGIFRYTVVFIIYV